MIRTFGLAALALLAASCAEEVNTSYVEKERLALREWMELNRPELLENYQEEGGYWVDVLEPGSDEAAPIRDTACWVRFTFTGRNLGGDIVLTRNETDARLVGSYTPFTRYVPYYKYYAGDTNTALLEGTYLSMHNRLKLGAAYAMRERGYYAVGGEALFLLLPVIYYCAAATIRDIIEDWRERR